MISFVKGRLHSVLQDAVIIETAGFGVSVRVPANVLGALPAPGSEVMIHTFMYVREDIINLFGFLSRDDLDIFKLLLNVSGVGPKGALAILSVMSTDELRMAVASADIKKISSAPGIGKKTAERLVLELKDKVGVPAVLPADGDVSEADAGVTDEAVSALMALGISGNDALRAVASVKDREGMTVEDLLKEALKNVAG